MSGGGGRPTVEALALLRVVSSLITGSNGRSVEASIMAGEVSEEDIKQMRSLSKDLNALVHLAMTRKASSSCPGLSPRCITSPTSSSCESSTSALVLSSENLSTVSYHIRGVSPPCPVENHV